jgi:hypothetical protein
VNGDGELAVDGWLHQLNEDVGVDEKNQDPYTCACACLHTLLSTATATTTVYGGGWVAAANSERKRKVLHVPRGFPFSVHPCRLCILRANQRRHCKL